jgi:hypothetical protein
VEGERKVSWNIAPVFGAVLAHLTPYMVLNAENIVILPSSNLGAAFINGFGSKLRLISEAGLSFPPLSAGITGLAPQSMAFQQACPFG